MKPKDRKFGLGVIIFILNSDHSKILLLKRNAEKRAKSGLDWGNVGGRVEPGELLLNACLREAKEEIGVDLVKEKLKLIEIKETPFISKEFHAIHFVYATVLKEEEKIHLNFNDKEESEKYEWFDLQNLPEKTLDTKEVLIKWANLAKENFNLC